VTSIQGQKLNQIPRTLDEILNFTSVEKKRVVNAFKMVIKELKMKFKTISPITFIPMLSNKLKLSNETQNRAIKVINTAKKYGINIGKIPTGFAGTALYIAAMYNGERRSQREISMAAGVSEATIRNRYKDLVKHLKIEQ